MKQTILFLFCLFSTLATHGQELTAFRNAVEGSYHFWFYTPVVPPTETKPLIIFLHGASLCGNNLSRVRTYGVIDAVEKGREVDAFVLAPQNPGGSWQPAKLHKLLEWAKVYYPIDTTRVYVLGMSLGGYGTIDFAGTYPHEIAAAMALCGGGTLKEYSGLCDLPLWIMHGTADRAVSISQSQRVVDGMTRAGNTTRLRWDKLAGANHGAPARVFYLPETYRWLFAHSLSDPDRPVNRDISITLSTMSTAYRTLPRVKPAIKVNNSGTPHQIK